MNRSPAMEILWWAALFFNAGYTLYAWFKLRGMFFDLIPLMIGGTVLIGYGLFLTLRQMQAINRR